MAIVTPGSLFQNGGNVSGQFDRLRHLFDTLPIAGDTTTLTGAGGVWPGSGAAVVSAQSTPNMTVQVSRFAAMAGGSQNNAQGMYPLFNDATIASVTITSSNTQQRIDSLVAENPDSFYSGVVNNAQVTVYPGSPGSGVPPTLTGLSNNYLVLANITVRANTLSIVNSDIANVTHYLCAPGGISPMQAYELGANGYMIGQYRDSLTTFDRWSGSTWVNQLVVGVGAGQAKYTAALTGTGANQVLSNSVFTAIQFINPVTTSADVTASGTNNNTFQLNRTGLWLIVCAGRIVNGSASNLFLQLFVPALTGDPYGAQSVPQAAAGTTDMDFTVLDRFTSGQQFSLAALLGAGGGNIGSGASSTGKRTSISFKWLGP